MDADPRQLVNSARAQYAVGNIAGAVRLCTQALEARTTATDLAALAEAATLVRRPVDPVLRARVHSLAAEVLALSRRAGPDADALALLVQAQLEATRDDFHDDQVSSQERLADQAHPERAFVDLQAEITASQDPLMGSDRLRLAARAVALGRACGNREYQAWGRLWAMDSHAVSGARAPLLGELAALTAIAEDLGPGWQAQVTLTRASQALLDGRFTDALRLTDQAKDMGGPNSDAAFLHLPFAFEVARLTGTVADVLPAVREQVDELPFVARTWLCVALKETGARAEAADEWAALAPHITALPPRAPEFLMAAVDAAALCSWLGDIDSASVLYSTLIAHAGLHAIPHARAPYAGPVALALGRLATVLGNHEAARDHLDAALQATQEIHALPYKAMVLGELAAREPARTRSRLQHTEAAVELGRRLGMTPLVRQVEALAQPRRNGDSALTSRENEVAALVAQGLSNAAIARKLTLSERTVENHVSRALLKLSLNSRSALAVWHERRSGQLTPPMDRASSHPTGSHARDR